MVKLAAHVVFLVLLRVSVQSTVVEDEEIGGGILLESQIPEKITHNYSKSESEISETENSTFHRTEKKDDSLMIIDSAEHTPLLDSFINTSIKTEPILDLIKDDVSKKITESTTTETSSTFSTSTEPETVSVSLDTTTEILRAEDSTYNEDLTSIPLNISEEIESLISPESIYEESTFTNWSTIPILNTFSLLQTEIHSPTDLGWQNSELSSIKSEPEPVMASTPILSVYSEPSETVKPLNTYGQLTIPSHIPTSPKSEESSLISSAKSSFTISHVSPISDLPGNGCEEAQPSEEDPIGNVSNMSNYKQGEKNHSEEGKFLSFEQWKKLKEAGNQLELSEVKVAIGGSKEKSPNANNASYLAIKQSSEHAVASLEDQGRVYKDKFNYASVDCAATIVKTNSDAKGASAILTEVKDSYLLNKCSASNKFVVIELCQDILVNSVVMGNFELFSSMFRTVKFSVSDRFPVTKGWHELGQFEAQNIRDTQTFNIENPLIWARYLKIEIVSHYGNEFYCPISLVRVHGKTMMEEFKDTDVGTEAVSPETHQIQKPTEEFLNNSAEFNSRVEECKVSTPYLALNEFLKDLNSTDNYCDVPLVSIDVPQTTTTETNNNKRTQESIFQNIVKRLSLLETNATLSLLYVEEQSKLLSDAFFNLEHRQVRKFENLLIHLNETMYTQVLYLEKAVEKIKTDSIRLFQAQSTQSRSSINSLRKETLSFAREISFLRKVVIADTLIILSLLAYVIITRETLTAEELTGKRKQQRELLPEEEGVSVIKPYSPRHNRPKGRRRKHN